MQDHILALSEWSSIVLFGLHEIQIFILFLEFLQIRKRIFIVHVSLNTCWHKTGFLTRPIKMTCFFTICHPFTELHLYFIYRGFKIYTWIYTYTSSIAYMHICIYTCKATDKQINTVYALIYSALCPFININLWWLERVAYFIFMS